MDIQIVKDAIKENPELSSKLVETLKEFDSDLVIAKKSEIESENKKHIDNQVKHKIQDEVNNAVKKMHEKSESKISELLGIDKPDGVKGYEWYADVISKQKEKITGLNTQLDSKLSGDEVSKKRIEALELEIETEKNKTKEALQKGDNLYKSSLADSSINKFKWDENTDEKLKSFEKRDLQRELESVISLQEDNSILLIDKEGKPLLNPDNSSKPYTVDEYVNFKLKDYAPKKVERNGLNGEPKNNKVDKNDPFETFVASKAPKNYDDIISAASEYFNGKKGYANGSVKRTAEINKVKQKYGY